MSNRFQIAWGAPANVLLSSMIAAVHHTGKIDDIGPRILWPMLFSLRLLHSLYAAAVNQYKPPPRGDNNNNNFPPLDLEGVKRAHAASLAFLYRYLIVPAAEVQYTLVNDATRAPTPMFVPVLLQGADSVVTHDFFDSRCIRDFLAHSTYSVFVDELRALTLHGWRRWIEDFVDARTLADILKYAQTERHTGRRYRLPSEQEVKNAFLELRDRGLKHRGRFMLHYDGTRLLLNEQGTYARVRGEISSHSNIAQIPRGFSAYVGDADGSIPPANISHLESRGLHSFVEDTSGQWKNVSAWALGGGGGEGMYRLLQPYQAGKPTVRDGLLPVAAREIRYQESLPARLQTLAPVSATEQRMLPYGYHSFEPAAALPPSEGISDAFITSEEDSPFVLGRPYADVTVLVEESAFTDWMRRVENLQIAHIFGRTPSGMDHSRALDDTFILQAMATQAEENRRASVSALAQRIAKFKERLIQIRDARFKAQTTDAINLVAPGTGAGVAAILERDMIALFQTQLTRGTSEAERAVSEVVDGRNTPGIAYTHIDGLLSALELEYDSWADNYAQFAQGVSRANQRVTQESRQVELVGLETATLGFALPDIMLVDVAGT